MCEDAGRSGTALAVRARNSSLTWKRRDATLPHAPHLRADAEFRRKNRRGVSEQQQKLPHAGSELATDYCK